MAITHLPSMTRCLSAPPLCDSEVESDSFIRQDINSELAMSPGDMSRYKVEKTMLNTPSCKVMVLEGGLVLKLWPIFIQA